MAPVTEAIRLVLASDHPELLPEITLDVEGVRTTGRMHSVDLDGTHAALGLFTADSVDDGRAISVTFIADTGEPRTIAGLVRWTRPHGDQVKIGVVIPELDPAIRATFLELAERMIANRKVYSCERRLSPVVPESVTLTDDNLRGRLLRQVLMAPDDDEPRLVYADWLTERGDPRGEFITIQCELARRGADASGPDVETLRAREAQLLARHKKQWIGRFAGTRIETSFGSKTHTKGSPTKWEFFRGFVEAVTMWTTDFARNAPALMACEPVHTLHLTNGYLTELVEHCPEIGLVRELDLTGWRFRGDELSQLAATHRLSSMQVLDLSKCRIGVNAMIAFASEAVAKPTLRELSLWWNAIGDKGAVALASSKFLGSLRDLDLCNNKIGARGANALAASPHLEHIELLDLSANEVGDPARAALRARFGTRVRLSR